jgi:hypothetical protein
MQDVNVSNELRQLSLGQVKALEYSRYDINGYHFWMAKLEASHPLIATTNSGLVTGGEDATGHVIDYYGILQNIVGYTFGGAKELKIVFFQCYWFDPINDTRVDEFGMLEVKHESRYSRSNFFLAHQAQQVYYLSYPHPSFKKWWVIYKVHPKMHIHRYDEYIEGHEDDEICQEEIDVDHNFMVYDGVGLTELDTDDVELSDEKAGSSKKRLQKSKRLVERQERHERLDARVVEADSDAGDF